MSSRPGVAGTLLVALGLAGCATMRSDEGAQTRADGRDTAAETGARAAAVEQPSSPDAAAVARFRAAVDQYLALRKDAARGIVPPLADKSDAAAISAYEKALGSLIRERRLAARPGDVFGPEIQPVFRRLLRAELTTPEHAGDRKQVKEENPRVETPGTPILVAVNAPYPSGASLSTVPAAVLLSLPRLPDELDYRFVGRDLVLRDTVANLIIDFVKDAVP